MNKGDIKLSTEASKLSSELKKALLLPSRSAEDAKKCKIAVQAALTELFEAKANLDQNTQLNILWETEYSPILKLLLPWLSIDRVWLEKIVNLYQQNRNHPFVIQETKAALDYLKDSTRYSAPPEPWFADNCKLCFDLEGPQRPEYSIRVMKKKSKIEKNTFYIKDNKGSSAQYTVIDLNGKIVTAAFNFGIGVFIPKPLNSVFLWAMLPAILSIAAERGHIQRKSKRYFTKRSRNAPEQEDAPMLPVYLKNLLYCIALAPEKPDLEHLESDPGNPNPQEENWLYKILPNLPVNIKINALKEIVDFQSRDFCRPASSRVKKILEILISSTKTEPDFIDCLQTNTVDQYHFINSQLTVRQKTNYATLILIFAVDLKSDTLRDAMLSPPYRNHINWGNYIYFNSVIYISPAKHMDLNIYPLSTYLLVEQPSFIRRYLELSPSYDNLKALFQDKVPETKITPHLDKMTITTTLAASFVDFLRDNDLLRGQFLQHYKMLSQTEKSFPPLEALKEGHLEQVQPISSTTFLLEKCDPFLEGFAKFPIDITQEKYIDDCEKFLQDYRYRFMWSFSEENLKSISKKADILEKKEQFLGESAPDSGTLTISSSTPIGAFLCNYIRTYRSVNTSLQSLFTSPKNASNIIFEYYFLGNFFEIALDKIQNPRPAWSKIVATHSLSTMPKITIFNESKPQTGIIPLPPRKCFTDDMMVFKLG